MISDKLVPYDGVPKSMIDKVATPLFIVILMLAVIGMVFALGCLAFNFAYRKTRCLGKHASLILSHTYMILRIFMQDYANKST